MLDDYGRLTALAIADLVRSGKAAAGEVTEAALAAIDRLNPRLNAVVLVDPDRARARAAHVDRSAPLAGVPVLIKDNNLFVEGWPTTFSSRFFADARPRPDSELIKRLRRAGCVLIGKTSTPEFAADWTTEPTLRGPTRNPWDRERSAGGSSGGSAAAVAAGMVPVAHGNDNAGSIRVPAAVCGLVGLKPTRGLVPVGAAFGELAAGLDCEFVLTRDVADAAALLDALAGPEPGGPYLVARGVPSYLAALAEPVPRLGVGYAVRRPDGSAIDGDIAGGLDRVVRLLAGAGHRIDEIELPDEPVLGAAAEAIGFAEIAWLVDRRAREIGRPPREDEIEALTALALERSRQLDAVGYLAARQTLHEGAQRVLATFAPYDLIVTPVTGEPAPPLGWFESRKRPFDAALWGERSARFAPFTQVFNVTGQPAIAVPVGLTRQGLPIGVQLAAGQGRDSLLLQVAARLLADLGGPMAPVPGAR